MAICNDVENSNDMIEARDIVLEAVSRGSR